MIRKTDFVKAKVNYHLTPCEALKQLRELQGLSQNELAEITGIPQTDISDLESGAKQLGRDIALILTKALRVHPSVILFTDYEINYGITETSYKQ